SALGRSSTTGSRRVPRPPARIAVVTSAESLATRSSPVRRSGGVAVGGPPFHPVALEQLADAVVEGAPRLEARLAQPPARDDVVALVGILADGGEVDVEVRHVLLDLQRQFLLREVGGVEAQV